MDDLFSLNSLIVAEGRGDAEAIRRALGDVEVLWTEGFGVTEAKLAYIARAAAERGVVVCTDPDHAGEMIRAKLDRHIPGLRHVYLPRRAARDRRGRDIGWEYASPAAVRAAFGQSRPAPAQVPAPDGLKAADLLELGLTGCAAAGGRPRATRPGVGVGGWHRPPGL
ncbi:MAG: RNAse M5, partial [Gracilibacteraceae bacterium]|nr:RNAse M5 [Gracilibacteraceae bacterium]